MTWPLVYLIGSLRNPQIPIIAESIREREFRVFDDWFSAGPHADDAWRDLHRNRGYSLPEALEMPAAINIYEFDKRHLDLASVAVLALPAGRSAHLELGYMIGLGRTTLVLLDNPERWDVMYGLCTGVATSLPKLLEML